MRTIARSIGVLLLCAASGCAVVDGGGGASIAAPDEGVSVRGASGGPIQDAATREVVDDFLYALVQLDGHAPDEATVRFSRDTLASDPFVAALERAMREQGYGVRLVPAGVSDGVRHRAEPASDGDETVHTLVVGELKMRRRYRRSPDGAPLPVGPLFVLGADASGIDSDRSRGSALHAAATPLPANRHVRVVQAIGELD